MLFDVLKNEDSLLVNERGFISDCLECERKVRTAPKDAIANARSIAETFTEIILERNGIEIPEDRDTRLSLKLDSIDDKIRRCHEEGFISDIQSIKLHNVRKSGNIVVHNLAEEASDAALIFRELYISVVTYATGEKVFNLGENEKRVVWDKEAKKLISIGEGYHTEDFLPINEYQVIGRMFPADAPSDRIRTYRCKKISIIENKEYVQYAIVRRFDKNSQSDIRQYRDIMAMNEIRRNYANIERAPILAEEINTDAKCPYRYLCYITAENTFLLNQEKRFKKYISSLKCETVEQQVLARLEIIRGIAEILYELTDIDENKSIHHRNLRPDCVFITPVRKGCSVSVGNFEYSKVSDSQPADPSNPTLQLEVHAKLVEGDPYAPREMRSNTNTLLNDPDWEQIDIYSLAKITMYIMCGSAADEKVAANLEDIRRLTSEEFWSIMRDIIENPYPTRPTLKAFLKAVKMEILRLE